MAPPGTEFYVAKRGDSVGSLARQSLRRTSYLTSSEFGRGDSQANGNRTGNNLKAGEQLLVPGILAGSVTEKSIPVPKDFEVRAIYLTGRDGGQRHGLRIIRPLARSGRNAVVFDIKDSDGSVNVAFDHPLRRSPHIYIHDRQNLTHFLHTQGMHTIARIAIFRDQRLVDDASRAGCESASHRAVVA